MKNEEWRMENGARNSSKPPCRILVLVEFRTHRVGYLRRPFQREPDFGVTSVNYDFAELIARSRPPQ